MPPATTFERKTQIKRRRILRERKVISDLVAAALKQMQMETAFHYQHVELTPRERKNIKASEFLQL
jgi:hypothetical protein